MKEQIKIMAKTVLWQEYYVDIPDGKTKKEFINELKENDPAANYYENNGIEILFDTEEVLEVEYYDADSDEQLNSIQIPNKYYTDISYPSI